MNDKQQLAAMGVQYRLTEEQAKGLAERMPQTGALHILDDEPMCMAKRIEELEAQVRVMAGLLAVHVPHHFAGASKMVTEGREPSSNACQLQKGWQLVPVKITAEMWDAMNSCHQSPVCWWDAALAAAPKLEAK